MKKIILFLMLLLIFWGCKKSTTIPNNPASYSGKYAIYKIIDTAYPPGPNNQILTNITHYTFTGDTAFLNVGTSQATVQPNPVPNYNYVDFLSDTMNFTSSTTGVENNANNVFPFTYSAQTGLFKNGFGSILSLSLIYIDPTKVELLVTTTYDGRIHDRSGQYYHKIN